MQRAEIITIERRRRYRYLVRPVAGLTDSRGRPAAKPLQLTPRHRGAALPH